MSTATLTSLAMLKVKIDQGSDYLDYLCPFILQILVDHRPDPVKLATVKNHVLSDFGLEIPEQTLQIVLKRLARKYPLSKDSGVYRITGDIPNPGIFARKAEANLHIQSVISGLIEYSKESTNRLLEQAEAEQALCSFLEEFDISFIKAYLRGTTIPSVSKKKNSDVILVSQYLLHLQSTNPERFRSFQILVQGHMLANALLCPDLANVPQTFKNVLFYLDTPLLVRWFGLEGQYKKDAIEELVQLVRKLGGSLATFDHIRDELCRVIQGAANHLEDLHGKSSIVLEARRQRISRSDLLLLSEQIDDKLESLDVEVKPTPSYTTDYQIDEMAFADVLDDEVSYFNPHAKEYDINSVRCIYVLRKGKIPQSLEKAIAVLVTTNAGFARAAFRYGERYEESREVSPVITDFSLANIAWLKAPMGAPTLPVTEVLAFSYAALELPKPMMDKFLAEIEKLENKGNISARDHQLLRCSVLAQEELMRMTLGEEDALNEQTITETLQRVTNEIKKEENEKYQAEQAAHRKTQEELEAERVANKIARERLYWRCRQRAKRCSWVIASVVGLVLFGGMAASFCVTPKNPVMGWILTTMFAILSIAGVTNLIFGFTIRQMRERLEKNILAWLLRRETAATGLNLEELHS